jgi:hypothetical protein
MRASSLLVSATWLIQAFARLAQMQKLLLKPRHASVGIVKLGLCGMNLVARGIVAFAQRFDRSFKRTQFGDLRFERILRRVDLAFDRFGLACGFELAGQRQQDSAFR